MFEYDEPMGLHLARLDDRAWVIYAPSVELAELFARWALAAQYHAPTIPRWTPTIKTRLEAPIYRGFSR